MGLCAYVYSQYTEYSELASKNGLMVGIAAGALVFACSFVGCLGAWKQNKCLLSVYSVIMFILLAVELAGAVAVLVYLGYMDDVSSDKVGELDTKITKTINDYELAAWEKCCLSVYCVDDNPAACPWIPANGKGGEAAPVQCSSNKTQAACYYATPEKFESLYLEWAAPAVCKALTELELKSGEPLVGNPNESADSCGGLPSEQSNSGALSEAGYAQVSQVQFQQDTNEWFRDHATPFAYFAIGLTVVQFLALFMTCCLICANREDYDEEYRRRMEHEMGSITGTGNPNGKPRAGYAKPTEYV